jgi:hypothetical protein
VGAGAVPLVVEGSAARQTDREVLGRVLVQRGPSQALPVVHPRSARVSAHKWAWAPTRHDVAGKGWGAPDVAFAVEVVRGAIGAGHVVRQEGRQARHEPPVAVAHRWTAMNND